MFNPEFTWSGIEFLIEAGAAPTNPKLKVPFQAPPIPQPVSRRPALPRLKPHMAHTTTPPTLQDTTSSGFMLLVSDYLGNSALWTLFEAHMLNFQVTPSMLPPAVPLKLNTRYFES